MPWESLQGFPFPWLQCVSQAALGEARLLLLSSWPGLGTSRQLSGPGGTRSGMPSLSSSSSHSSPIPSLSVSSWALLMTVGQLSVLSWWPSPSLPRRKVIAQERLSQGGVWVGCQQAGLYQTLSDLSLIRQPQKQLPHIFRLPKEASRFLFEDKSLFL